MTKKNALSSPEFYTSPLSRFCDQHLGAEFNFLDGDEVLLRYASQPITHARETRILRVLESKRPGEQLRRSQREVLPLLAAAVKIAVESGTLAAGSGVFIVEGEEPFVDGANVSQVLPASESRAAGIQTIGPVALSREQIGTFVSCRRVFGDTFDSKVAA